MEIWEGAILAVGGLWLVGYMSRKNAAHPLNSGVGTSNTSNLTTIGVAAASGSTDLIAGEPVAPPARPTLAASTGGPKPFLNVGSGQAVLSPRGGGTPVSGPVRGGGPVVQRPMRPMGMHL